MKLGFDGSSKIGQRRNIGHRAHAGDAPFFRDLVPRVLRFSSSMDVAPAGDPMKSRTLLKNLVLGLASTGIGMALVVACSSSSTPSGGSIPTCQGSDVVACTCANGQTGTGQCNDPSSCSCNTPSGSDAGCGSDAAPSDDDGGHNGDGGHVDNAPSPAALYDQCYRAGSFGAPCTVDNGPDPTNCTDPNFPYCFGGGQGYWCTAECGDGGTDFSTCLIEVPDGGFPDAAGDEAGTGPGCTPSACNAKGYCK